MRSLLLLLVFAVVSCQREHDSAKQSTNKTNPVEHQEPAPAPDTVPLPPEATTPQTAPLTDPFAGVDPPYSHAQMEQFRKMRQRIWESRLGQLFRSFLDVTNSDQIMRLSSAITERVFSVPGEDLARLAALQVMEEDVYEKGEFTPEISYRISILRGNVDQRQMTLNSIPMKRLIRHAPYFIVIAFLAGSEELALQMRGAMSSLTTSATRALRSGNPSGFFPVELEKSWKALLPNFFTGYQPMRALSSFMATFGPYSFVSIYLFRQENLLGPFTPEERIFLYGLQELIEISDL